MQKYSTNIKEIDEEIQKLSEKYSEPGKEQLMRQLFTSIVKLHLDKCNEADLKLINTSLKEMRHAFRIFSRWRNIKKVVIWGSSKIKPGAPEYKIAKEFAKKISKLGFMVITGG
ncbi:MAG: cytochrome D ubiquinol oxidase subunit II, partial [Candidatus Saganbacteria bacterium]|nr:cytochrome D ubiquinol oxidase subunit II [Candidatus Saganbacteria bacterium]